MNIGFVRIISTSAIIIQYSWDFEEKKKKHWFSFEAFFPLLFFFFRIEREKEKEEKDVEWKRTNNQ